MNRNRDYVDATIGTLLDVVLEETDIESDQESELKEQGEPMPAPPSLNAMRRAVLAVVAPQWDEGELGKLPAPNDTDRAVWRELFEPFYETILWDFDFEDEEEYVDQPPEVSQAEKGRLHIDDDYFTVLAPIRPPSSSAVTWQRWSR